MIHKRCVSNFLMKGIKMITVNDLQKELVKLKKREFYDNEIKVFSFMQLMIKIVYKIVSKFHHIMRKYFFDLFHLLMIIFFGTLKADDIRIFVNDDSQIIFKWVSVKYDDLEDFASENDITYENEPVEITSRFVKDIDKDQLECLENLIGESNLILLITDRIDGIFLYWS